MSGAVGRRVLAIAAIAALGAAACQRAADVGAPASRWLVLSDLHFNPAAAPALVDRLAAAPPGTWTTILETGAQLPSTYKKDTNYALLRSAIDAMRASLPDPELVVIGGDLLAHNLREDFEAGASDRSEDAYRAFVDATIAYLAAELGAAFPRAPFALALGNNDSYCGDYALAPGSAFLAQTARAWEPLVNRDGRAPGFAEAFAARGAYRLRLPLPDATLVVVNSVFWSARYTNSCGDAGADPGGDALAWLEGVLADLPPGERAGLLSHVPLGIDVFATLRAPAPVALLEPSAQARLAALLAARPWALAFAGHLHMNSFQIVGDLAPLVVPSISPVFLNNPSYLTVRVDRASARVTDYQAHVLPLGNGDWTVSYRFQEAYATGVVTPASMVRLHDRLEDEAPLREQFERRYGSGSRFDEIQGAQWRAYWCAMGAITPAEYTACLAGGEARPHGPPAR